MICAWAPRMRSTSSIRKPFITDITTISVPTPSMIPASENPAMTEIVIDVLGDDNTRLAALGSVQVVTGDLAGAALAYQPNGIETLKVAEIFNITRVLFLPVIVLWLAAWYVKHEEGAQKAAHLGPLTRAQPQDGE